MLHGPDTSVPAQGGKHYRLLHDADHKQNDEQAHGHACRQTKNIDQAITLSL
jgi:hypothetical protein